MKRPLLSVEATELQKTIVGSLAHAGRQQKPAAIVDAACTTFLSLHDAGRTDKMRVLSELIEHHAAALSLTAASKAVLTLLLRQETRRAVSIISRMLAVHPTLFAELQPLLAPHNKNIAVRQLIDKMHSTARASACKPVQETAQQSDEQLPTLEAFIAAGAQNNALLLRILQALDGAPRNGLCLSKATLESVVPLVAPETGHTLPILTLLAALSRSPTASTPLTGPFSHLITSTVLAPEASEEATIELFRHLADRILPALASCVRALCEEFIRVGRFVPLLKNILQYVGYDAFVELASPVSFQAYFLILKGVANADIASFLDAYNSLVSAASQDSAAQAELNSLIGLLPGFCNYATDVDGRIGELLTVMLRVLPARPNVVCNALDNLVRTQAANLHEALVLPRPIPRTTSAAILEAVCSAGCADAVVAALLRSQNNECDSAMAALVAHTGFDITADLVASLLQPNAARMPPYDVLRLLCFYTPPYSFELLSALLELSVHSDSRVQKKAHAVLARLVARGVPNCICDLFFTSAAAAVQPPAYCGRLALLMTLVRRPCASCKLPNLPERVFGELVERLVDGNCRCKRLAAESVAELGTSSTFRQFLLANLDGAEGMRLRGCIAAAHLLIEHIFTNQLYQAESAGPSDNDFLRSVFVLVRSCTDKSADTAREVLLFVGLLLDLPQGMEYAREILEILATYARVAQKKHIRDLRECVFKARAKGLQLSRPLHALLHRKNSGGAEPHIQVLKEQCAD